MSDIAPDILPFLVAALEDEMRERHRQRQLHALAVVVATIIVRRYGPARAHSEGDRHAYLCL